MRATMALWQLRSALILLYLSRHDFGKCVEVILGDSFTFPETENCEAEEGKLIHRIAHDRTQLVAYLSDGLWVPDDYYRNRVNQNASVHFNRTVFNDSGTYELICAKKKDTFIPIQLKVVVPYEPSVTQGDTVKLKCYCDSTGKRVTSVKWTKHGKLVFERNFSTGKDELGAGYEEKLSLSPEGYKEGDLSLIVKQAQMEDEGVYLCYVGTEGQTRSDVYVAAVRVTVNTHQTANTATQPPCAPKENQMETWVIIAITAAVMFVIVAATCAPFGWCLKSRCSKVSHEPSTVRYQREVTEPLNGGPPAPPPPVNGCPLLNGSYAESNDIN